MIWETQNDLAKFPFIDIPPTFVPVMARKFYSIDDKQMKINIKTHRKMPRTWKSKVDSAVASDTRGPGFESSHRWILNNYQPYLLLVEKTKIKKRPWMAHLKYLFAQLKWIVGQREKQNRERYRERNRNRLARKYDEIFANFLKILVHSRFD